MASIGDVQLAVNADMTKFEGQVVKGASKSGDKASKGFAKQFGKGLNSKDLLGGLGLGQLAGIGALTAGTAALTNVIFDSIDAASNQREAMSLGTQVFEDQTDKIERWAAGAADAFGQSKTEALNFASSFGNAFKNVGFAIDDTAQKSMDLTHLAADLGSAFNKSSEEAATALRSGLLGESEPLRAFGVFLSEAAVDAELMRKGQKKVNGAWTDGQKVLARYNIIMRQTADSQGMFGRDTESLADTQKALNAEWQNILATIGEELVPVMRDLAGGVKDEVLPAFTDLIEEIKAGHGPIVEVAKAFDDMGKQLDFLSGANRHAGQETDMLGSKTSALGQVLHDIFDPGWRGPQQVNDFGGQLGRAGALAGKATPPIDKVGGAIEDVGTDADTAKRKVRDLMQELLDHANQLIARYYDPIEMRQRMQANDAEITSAKRILASRTASTAEKRDARETITQAQRSNDELSIALLATGKMTKKEHDQLIKRVDHEIATTTGAARGYFRRLRQEIAKLDGLTAYINVVAEIRSKGVGSKVHEGGAASGGFRPAGWTGMVGEAGTERLHALRGGGIIVEPHRPEFPSLQESAEIMRAGGGGGPRGDVIYQVHLLDKMEVRSVRDIGDGLRMLGERGYLGRHLRDRRHRR